MLKTLYLTYSVIFTPPIADLPAYIASDVMVVEDADESKCAEAIKEWNSAGPIGNLPGYSYVRAAWCE